MSCIAVGVSAIVDRVKQNVVFRFNYGKGFFVHVKRFVETLVFYVQQFVNSKGEERDIAGMATLFNLMYSLINILQASGMLRINSI